jgi:predicted RNase H-like nuclease
VAALSAWVDVSGALGHAPDGVPVDDALDALAAAWTALRVSRGTARTYPGDPPPGEPVILA